jgi:hypothetical protein
VNAYPECTREEGYHAASKSRLLAFGCDTFINTFSEPDIGLDVPRVEEGFEVGRDLNLQDFDIGRAVPSRFAIRTKSSEAQPSDDTGTLVRKKLKVKV